MSIEVSTTDTPAGPLTFLVHEGAVIAGGFTPDPERLTSRLPSSLREQQLRERRSLGAVSDAVTAYFGGAVDAWDGIPVRQAGGPFISHAWSVLRGIRAGEVVTYTEFAARCGRPVAVRAAAAACARNLIAPIVPCHRVLRTDGSLGGYYWGLPVKRWLIDHEAAG